MAAASDAGDLGDGGSEFHGIAIFFYFQDHLPPHFHAVCSGMSAQVTIETLALLAGSLPRAKLRRVKESRVAAYLLAASGCARDGRAPAGTDPTAVPPPVLRAS
ncbi:MAG: DUF4160 domain-containing protein [Planctomycetes bacterium]|nr:DUF4160 domain-containing protein [Planctomycetota bacterium]